MAPERKEKHVDNMAIDERVQDIAYGTNGDECEWYNVCIILVKLEQIDKEGDDGSDAQRDEAVVPGREKTPSSAPVRCIGEGKVDAKKVRKDRIFDEVKGSLIKCVVDGKFGPCIYSEDSKCQETGENNLLIGYFYSGFWHLQLS